MIAEQKHPKFLRSLQNAQGDTTNLAVTRSKQNKISYFYAAIVDLSVIHQCICKNPTVL